MELLMNDLVIDHIEGSAAAQALIEGELPLPDAHAEAAAILDQSGEISITGVEVIKDKLMLDGTLTAELICTAPDGTPFSFRSGTSFRHTVEVPGADPGMEGLVMPILQSLTCTPESGMVKLTAIVDLNCRVQSRSPVRVLSGIRDVPDLLVKPQKIRTCSRHHTGRASLRIREELSASNIAEVIRVKAGTVVNSLSPVPEGILAEGAVMLSALCKSNSGDLSQLNHQFPFSETIGADTGVMPQDAVARVSACSLRCMGEGSGILAAEVELTLELFRYDTEEHSIAVDAYSPAAPMECTRKPLNAISYLPALKKRTSLRESVAIPEGWPSIERCVFTNAHPVITGSHLENGQLTLDGLLVTRIVYECAEGKIHAFSEDVPFLLNTELPMESTDSDANILCLCASSMGSGSAADVNYSLLLELHPLALEELLPVTGAASSDAPPPPRGIVLYFAGAGETLWDVAKRFGTTPDALRASNPDLGEELSEGERLLLFLRRQI